MVKIYSDDESIPYKTTTVNASTTKAQIEGILARWGIRKYGWDWNPEASRITLVFTLPDKFGKEELHPTVRLEAPIIWTKGNRKRSEEVNWNISMRVLYWYIKTNLEAAYLWQFDKTTGFLPWIATSENKTLRDIILPRLAQLSEFPALTEEEAKNSNTYEQEKEQLNKVITVPSSPKPSDPPQ